MIPVKNGRVGARTRTEGQNAGEALGLAKASIAPMGMRALGTVLGFLVSVMIGRRLGDEVLGSYAVGSGAMLLGASVARLGQDIELTRFIASAGASSGATPWGVVCGVLLAVARNGLGLALLGSAFAVAAGLGATVIVGVLAIPGVAVVGALAGVARGLNRPALAVGLDAVVVPLGTLPMVLLAGDSVVALAGHGAVWATTAVVGLLLVYRHEGADSTSIRSLMRVGAPLAGLAALNIALAATDVVLVNFLRGSAQAGHYTAAARLAFISTSVLVVANAVLQPRIAALWHLGQRDVLRRLLGTATALLAAAAVVVTATLTLGARPLLLIFGGEFEAAVAPLRVLAIGQFVMLASGPVGAVLLMTGHSRRQIQATVIAVFVNIVADIILIPRYGVMGAAIATALALSVKNLTGAFWAWRVVSVRS
jgi:O-antigen/teichoic acid export membrane protein